MFAEPEAKALRSTVSQRMKTANFIVCLSLSTLPALAQGTVLFKNYVIPVGINAPILEPDGVSRPAAGSILVQLHASPTATSLAPVGVAIPIGQAGYYDGGVVAIPTVAPGERAWVQVFAWDAPATGFADAMNRGLRYGISDTIIVTTGGVTDPPSVAAPLVGLNSTVLQVQVPEPSAAALLVLGGALLFGWKRHSGLAPRK